jgi:molybdopterin-guanine dinucleotide biosynthesis protein A
MGQDKALLPFRGITLARAVADAVRTAAGACTLVGGPDGIPDRYPGEGPLGGILTALAHSKADWNLLVACDMPEVSGDFLAGLLAAAEGSDGDALLPVGPSGQPEPLCAVYHKRCQTPFERSFAGGVRKVRQALEEVRCVPWPVAEVSYFQNVNTPEDWAPYGR